MTLTASDSESSTIESNESKDTPAQKNQHCNCDSWFYPDDIKNDLKEVHLPTELKAETLACAWEYTRCVIPQFTNWTRYIAFTRIIVIGIITEFRGSLVDIMAGDSILGYDLQDLLDTVFGGTPGHEEMAREYRTFLLITGDKCSERRNSELFRRYVNALAKSPKDWFRLRDCDALSRFTIAAALACNDFEDVWFSEDELQILAELSVTMYDAVAFYKHRAEGETNSTFAYAGDEPRIESYRHCREVLWALDVAWAQSPAHRCIIHFLRPFGGPIHMMMRRYRFIEDGLTVGKTETDEVVAQTRKNFKLWNRLDATNQGAQRARFSEVLTHSEKVMFHGLHEILENSDDGRCNNCQYRDSYGAKTSGHFGGVELCGVCRRNWQAYLKSFPERAKDGLPILSSQLPAVDASYKC